MQTFDMNKFEKEYQEFILELKKKKNGETVVEEQPLEILEQQKEELKIEEPQLQIEQPKIEESQPQKVIIGKKITPKPKETIDQKYKKIIRIKEDIKNGRIQRVLDKDGKLVWKRVR